MWYKAKCVRECIFRGVRRRPGQIYEGPVKPPAHFEILEEREDGAPGAEKRTVCPFCGNELSAEKPGPEPKAEPGDDPGKKHSRLKGMNKDKLAEYAATLGLELDMVSTKEAMIDAIQVRELEVANEGVK